MDTRKAIDELKAGIGFSEALTTENIGKLSIVGVGMKSHSGVAGRMFEVLANAGVNIEMISTSEIKISVVIDEADGPRAVRALHRAFDLGSAPERKGGGRKASRKGGRSARKIAPAGAKGKSRGSKQPTGRRK